jgi:hypothetical protein
LAEPALLSTFTPSHYRTNLEVVPIAPSTTGPIRAL